MMCWGTLGFVERMNRDNRAYAEGAVPKKQ